MSIGCTWRVGADGELEMLPFKFSRSLLIFPFVLSLGR